MDVESNLGRGSTTFRWIWADRSTTVYDGRVLLELMGAASVGGNPVAYQFGDRAAEISEELWSEEATAELMDHLRVLGYVDQSRRCRT